MPAHWGQRDPLDGPTVPCVCQEGVVWRTPRTTRETCHGSLGALEDPWVSQQDGDGSVLIRTWKKLVQPAVIKHVGLCSVCPYSVCDQGLPEWSWALSSFICKWDNLGAPTGLFASQWTPEYSGIGVDLQAHSRFSIQVAWVTKQGWRGKILRRWFEWLRGEITYPNWGGNSEVERDGVVEEGGI